jgi:pilus assembly protein CpaB
VRRRSGLIIMIGGLLLAVVSGLLVVSISRANNVPPEVRQVLVVVAARDIPELVPVFADALVVKPFPEGFVPAGAISAPEQAVGKFTTTRIIKDQIIVAAQLSPTRRAGNVAASVPKGKVAVAFPGNDILSGIGAIRAGDRVDILLTLNLPRQDTTAPGAPPPTSQLSPVQTTSTLSVQTTMQNVEVLAVGQEATAPSNTVSALGAGRQPGNVITFLVDHQDALVLKFIKDSGGIIDLALRSPDDSQAVQTDAVTLSTIYDQFKFRLAGPLRP